MARSGTRSTPPTSNCKLSARPTKSAWKNCPQQSRTKGFPSHPAPETHDEMSLRNDASTNCGGLSRNTHSEASLLRGRPQGAVAANVQARPTEHALSRRGAFLAGRKWHKRRHGTYLDPPDGRCARSRRPGLGHRADRSNTGSTRIGGKESFTFAHGSSTLYSNSRRGTACLRPRRPAAMSALK